MPFNPDDQKKIVDAHNVYRSDPSVNTPNLVWDSTLAAGAQSWADNLATNLHGLQHSQPPTRPTTIGENLAQASKGSSTLAQMVDLWGKTVSPPPPQQGRSEQAQFKPGITPNVSKDGGTVGHYTQMIWRTTTSVGCGLASDGTNDYLVCRYSPAGNGDGVGVPSPQPVTLAQVSVANSTTAFGVDAANNVYMYSSTDGTNWTPQYSITGQQLKQVSIASDYTVCGLDPSGNPWQYSINDNAWTKMTAGPVAFISLSCGASNTIWAVGTDNSCYQNTGSGWTKVALSGQGASQVSVTSDGTIWVLEINTGYLLRYTGSGWTVVSSGGWTMTQLSGGSATNLWAMGLNSQFYQYTAPSTPGAVSWTQAAPGTGKQVSVASDGTAWSIGINNQVSRLVNNAWTPLLV